MWLDDRSEEQQTDNDIPMRRDSTAPSSLNLPIEWATERVPETDFKETEDVRGGPVLIVQDKRQCMLVLSVHERHRLLGHERSYQSFLPA